MQAKNSVLADRSFSRASPSRADFDFPPFLRPATQATYNPEVQFTIECKGKVSYGTVYVLSIQSKKRKQYSIILTYISSDVMHLL